MAHNHLSRHEWYYKKILAEASKVPPLKICFFIYHSSVRGSLVYLVQEALREHKELALKGRRYALDYLCVVDHLYDNKC